VLLLTPLRLQQGPPYDPRMHRGSDKEKLHKLLMAQVEELAGSAGGAKAGGNAHAAGAGSAGC
jgi:hypothetical protein